MDEFTRECLAIDVAKRLTIGSAATSLALGEFGEGLRRENSLVQEWFGEIYATSILA